MTLSKDRSQRAARKSSQENPARSLPNGSSGAAITPEERHRRIAEAAYYRALRRGFQEGDALDDWTAAEREVDAVLLSERESSVSSREGASVSATKSTRGTRERSAPKS